MITKTLFGKTNNNEEIYAYDLTNKNGVCIRVLTLGGILQSIKVQGRNGNFEDITTGFDDVAAYESNPAYFGAIIGRVANRIFRGDYEVDGVHYKAPLNQEEACLHGGLKGFDKKVWKADVTKAIDGQSEQLELTYLSEHGEESFPGNLNVKVVYKLDEDEDVLTLTFTATTDATTIINLTNHAYFNLAGHHSPNIYNHKLQVFAEHYLPKTKFCVPDGTIHPVHHTPLDFTTPRYLGDRIKMVVENGVHGIDHNFCLKLGNGSGGGEEAVIAGEVCHAIHMEDEHSGRVLDLYTDQPGVQVYTGNYLDGLVGKGGVRYHQHSSVALEAQLWPDAVHQPHFPSMLLRPGDIYKNVIVYKFSTVG